MEALLAEVERLRAENDQLAHEVMVHQTTSDFSRGHELGTLTGMKARNVVSRSALVQVGCNKSRHLPDEHFGCQPVYVIREDNDGH